MMEETTQNEIFIVRSNLIARGWTEVLIEKWLSEPDKYKKNPHYKSGPQMKLYSINRVESIEALPEFVIEKEKILARKSRLKKVED